MLQGVNKRYLRWLLWIKNQMSKPLFSIVVLISGHGSNLQAIIDQSQEENALIQVNAVVSNVKGAYGLERTKKAGIPSHIIEHQNFQHRECFDLALIEKIDPYHPELIVLAGFMRRLGSSFVRHYQGRLINIHPALLPKYPGLNTHRRVLQNREQRHGCSIHFVTNQVDGGPVIAYTSLTVKSYHTADTLKQSVQKLEHKLYPKVLTWFADRRVSLHGDRVFLDSQFVSLDGVEIAF